MAVTIQSVTPDSYDASLDFQSDFALLARALGGDQKAANRVTRDGCDFLVQARTSTNDAATSVIELMTARLVPFPAGFGRFIEWEAIASGATVGTESVWLRRMAWVTGGTTPVLVAGTLLGGPGTVTGAVTQEHSSSLGAGVTTPTSTLTVGAGVVNINISSGDTGEIVNWTVRVKIGKLIPMIPGV